MNQKVNSMIWKKSIITRLVIGIIIPVVIIFMLASIFIVQRVHQALMDAADYELSANSKIAALDVELFFTKYIEIVSGMTYNVQSHDLFTELSRGIKGHEADSYASIVKTFDNILASDENITLVWTADFDSGESVRSGGVVRGLPDYDITTRSWYAEIMANKTLIITEPYHDSVTGEVVTSIISPVWDGNDLIGVVVIDIEIADLNEIMAAYEFGETSYITLISSEGSIVYHPETDFIEMKASEIYVDASINNAIMSGIPGNYTYVLNGVVMRGELIGILNTGWLVLTAIEEYVLLTPYYNVENTLYVIFGIGVAILVLVCLVVSRAVIKPISAITADALEIAKGNFAIKHKYKYPDEIGQLSKSLKKVMNSTNGLFEDINRVYSEQHNGNNRCFLNDRDYEGAYAEKASQFNRLIKNLIKYKNETEAKHTQNKNVQVQTTTDNGISGFMESLKSIPDINTQIGLSRFAGVPSLYYEMMEVFYKNLLKGIKDLSYFFDKQDLKNFAIVVHGLKSQLSTVGAMFMSEDALKLETASKESNMDYIAANFPPFKNELLELHTSLSKIIVS